MLNPSQAGTIEADIAAPSGEPRDAWTAHDYFIGPHNESVLRSLNEGIREHQGVQILVGEPGSGRSSALRHLVAGAPGDVQFVICPGGDLHFEQILNLAVDVLGLSAGQEHNAKSRQFVEYLDSCFRRGIVVALIIDDAHQLRDESLQRLFQFADSSFQTRRALRLVLSGPPSIRDVVGRWRASHPLVAKAAFVRLVRLGDAEAVAFARYQLQRLGSAEWQSLSAESIARLIEPARGNPGGIKAQCVRALASAEASGRSALTAEIIEQTLTGRVAGPQRESAGDAHGNDASPHAASERSRQSVGAAPRRPVVASRPFERAIALGGAGVMLAVAATVTVVHFHQSLLGQRDPPPSEPVAQTAAPAAEAAAPVATADASTAAPPERKADAAPARARAPSLRSTQRADAEVTALLGKARRALARDHLVTPREDNAAKWARAVLQRDPTNRAASQILAEIVDRYARWSAQALRSGDTHRALVYLERAAPLRTYATSDQLATMDYLGSEIELQCGADPQSCASATGPSFTGALGGLLRRIGIYPSATSSREGAVASQRRNNRTEDRFLRDTGP